MMDGFLTLMVPYLKSGVRSEYAVQAFIKQQADGEVRPEVIVTPISQKVDCRRGGPSRRNSIARLRVCIVFVDAQNPDHCIIWRI